MAPGDHGNIAGGVVFAGVPPWRAAFSAFRFGCFVRPFEC
jgi:hypothetical protein